MPASKGSLFSQGDFNKGNGGRDGRKKRGMDDKTYDRKYCKDKECYKCGEKGHLESHLKNSKKLRQEDIQRDHHGQHPTKNLK